MLSQNFERCMAQEFCFSTLHRRFLTGECKGKTYQFGSQTLRHSTLVTLPTKKKPVSGYPNYRLLLKGFLNAVSEMTTRKVCVCACVRIWVFRSSWDCLRETECVCLREYCASSVCLPGRANDILRPIPLDSWQYHESPLVSMILAWISREQS